MPIHPQDRYEIEQALEKQMDEGFGEHFTVHIWALEPNLDLVFGIRVEDRPDWWMGRYGA